jgi:DNA polymerase III delta' subunit
MAARKKPDPEGAPARSGKTAASAAAAAAAKGQSKPVASLRLPIGQGAFFLRMVVAARAMRIHHAVILSGAQGTGKSTIARWLAAALMCPSDHDVEAPCGVCRHCRRIASGIHPDLHLLRPLDQKLITSVEQVRELQDTLKLSLVEARARVVLIDPCEALNEEGQNTLLKTLEEPSAGTFIVLCTSRPEQLLPTVRSRCEQKTVRGMTNERIAQELLARNVTPFSHHERAIRLAHGSLGRALDACTERTVHIHDLVLATFADSKALRPLSMARNLLEGSDGRADAVVRVRLYLQLCAGEAGARMQHKLASGAQGSYPPTASEPWASVLELALLGLQDLELQIPADQVTAGVLLGIARLLRGAHAAPNGTVGRGS